MCELRYNELRKGNLLYFPFISGNVEVIGINALYGVNEPYFNKLSVMEGINIYYEQIGIFRPIPLTEDWLIKFGFEKLLVSLVKKEDYIYRKDLLMMFRFKKSDIWYCCPYGYPIDVDRSLHVHQLQNLYFALTGEELTHQKIN